MHRKSLRSLSSAHEKWGQKQKCCIYNFVQCISCCFIYATDFKQYFVFTPFIFSFNLQFDVDLLST